MAKKVVAKSEELFTVNGFTIRKSGVYKIENRFDANAPSGFQNERTTKIPSVDIANSIQCNYVNGIWDTGFYETSPCYAKEGLDQAQRTERVKNLDKLIVKPFEEERGNPGLLKQTSEFWDGFIINIYEGRVFSTTDPKELLELYIALLSGELCPEDETGNPRYEHAQYVIIDKEKEKSVRQKKDNESVNAIGKFYVLLHQNPTKLVKIMKYLGFTTINEKTETDTIMSMFMRWIDSKAMNAKDFVEIVDKIDEDKSFEEVIVVYSVIRKAADSNKFTKSVSGDYTYQGIPLGKDLKSVARNLVEAADLSEVKAQLLEEFMK